MNPVAVGVAVVLAISVSANLYLASALGDSKTALGLTEGKLSGATSAAEACSRSVAEMTSKAENQALEASKAVAAAQARARAAEARARGELTRPQAVPGDACASAEVETREWLQKRRVAP